MKIIFDRDEKTRILSIVGLWSQDQLTFQRFRDIQVASGVPARLVETVFWLEDTLGILKDHDHLIMKGGTCVQCYIPYSQQRASVDIDMNTDIQNPLALKEYLLAINEGIAYEDRSCSIQDIEFGTLNYEFHDEYSGTISFTRRMPSRFGEFEIVGNRRVMSKTIRIQVNYKNHWMPAMETLHRYPDFFIHEYERPNTKIIVPMESPGDLFADKILTVCNVGGFGRERFKDVYDLIAMRHLFQGRVRQVTSEKLRLIATRSGIEVTAIIDGAVETVSSFSNRAQEAKGFASMVCREGKERIKRWELECEELADTIAAMKV